MQQPVDILKTYWGYDGFRPMQEEIIRHALDGEDVLAILPTGGGKSVCFQVPALMRDGLALVVTPLVALMKDQVRNLQERGVRALAIHAGMGRHEVDLALNNACLEGHPSDMVINTHVCRGNYHSTFANRGAYTAVSRTLFAKENVNAFYLEFDDERSGGFDPLADVSGNKKVVLGLITTKSPVLEDKEAVKERIAAAAKYLPLERLCLSPQCGVASCEIGNKLTEEQQWAKLRLVKEIAEEVWGR